MLGSLSLALIELIAPNTDPQILGQLLLAHLAFFSQHTQTISKQFTAHLLTCIIYSSYNMYKLYMFGVVL